MSQESASDDAMLFQSWQLHLAGSLGGAAGTEQTKESIYRAIDELERASNRRMTPYVFLTFFTFAKSLGSSTKRRGKLVWDLFSLNGHMYPGRLLDLGSRVASAFKVNVGDDELHIMESMMRFTPRGHLSYVEWMSWVKMMSKTHPLNFALILNGFGIVNYFTKMTNRLIAQASRAVEQGREYACKARINQDIFSSVVKVSKGMSTLTKKEKKKNADEKKGFLSVKSGNKERLHELLNAVVMTRGAKVLMFTPCFGEGLKIKCKSIVSRNQLISAIRSFNSGASSFEDHRFRSFQKEDVSPVLSNWYVDGSGYYDALFGAFQEARREILISDWSFQPEIYLRRGPGSGPEHRLDNVLKQKAAQGVQIFILLWWEVAMAVNGAVNTAHVRDVFENVPNITVLCHPINNVMGRWSHHQKFVVLDRAIAFVGGIDLCFGRYDTQKHVLVDDNHLALQFPGKDFYNPSIEVNAPLDEPFFDNIDRTCNVRMPWHDHQVSVTGLPCSAVAQNFVERWNKTLADMSRSGPTLGFDVMPSSLPCCAAGFPILAQVVRSLSAWSGINKNTEASILAAYEYVIDAAEHFIYIENQFFVSSTEVVQNQVANWLANRIARAVEEGDDFKVIIVLPLHPEGPFDSPTPRIVSLWIHRTIKAMRQIFLERCPNATFENYVSFHCLIQHAMLQGKPVLSMIYVHSKLIIADDRLAIVGSANINDRSLLGDRDSEVGIFFSSCDDHEITMKGTPGFKCSKMLHTWRLSAWREHLGVDQTTDDQISDPFEGAKLFRSVSDFNFVLLDPVVAIEPYRIWCSLSSGLQEAVATTKLAGVISEWLMDKLTGHADACGCCKSNSVGPSECAMCSGALCPACVVDWKPNANVRDRRLRRGAATASALKLGIALSSADSGHAVLCHLCSGRPCSVISGNQKAQLASPDMVEDGVADFRLLGALKLLDLPTDAEFVNRFLRKCSQDRVLALSVASCEPVKRLAALRGHIFPYPCDLCPRVPPSVMSAVPVEVFI